VGAVVVVIANVIVKKSLEMVLVQSDDVVEHIAAAASDPALGNAVGSGRQLHSIETIQNDVSA
jgi:hypothetical protein